MPSSLTSCPCHATSRKAPAPRWQSLAAPWPAIATSALTWTQWGIQPSVAPHWRRLLLLTPGRPLSMSSWMYIDVEGAEVGPLNTEQLQEHLATGKCVAHTLVHSLAHHTTLSAQRALEACSPVRQALQRVWQSRFATVAQLREMLTAVGKKPLGKKRLGPVLLPVSAELDAETERVHIQVRSIGLKEAIFDATRLYYELEEDDAAEAAAVAAEARAARRAAKAEPPKIVAKPLSPRAEAPRAKAPAPAADAKGLPEVREAFKAAVCDIVHKHLQTMRLDAATFKHVAANTVRKATETVTKNGNMKLWKTKEAAVGWVGQEKESGKLRKLAMDYLQHNSRRGPAAPGASRGGQENDGESDGRSAKSGHGESDAGRHGTHTGQE